jgi:hypothetical protein
MRVAASVETSPTRIVMQTFVALELSKLGGRGAVPCLRWGKLVAKTRSTW